MIQVFNSTIKFRSLPVGPCWQQSKPAASMRMILGLCHPGKDMLLPVLQTHPNLWSGQGLAVLAAHRERASRLPSPISILLAPRTPTALLGLLGP